MIYVLLALLVYFLFQVPYLTKDLPYVQYQPKNARIAERDRQIINRAVLWFTLAGLILFAGLRDYSVGWDLSLFYYGNAWNKLVESNATTLSYEWFYKVLSWVGYYTLGAEYGLTFVLLVCAAIVVLGIYFAGKMTSTNLGLLMFFLVACVLYLRGFSTIRQCAAVALCALGAAWLMTKKPLWLRLICFAVCLVFASGLHLPTAVVFLPVVFLLVVKSDFWQMVLWAEAIFLGFMFLHYDNQVVQIFGKITGRMYYYNFYMANAYATFDWNPIDAIECTLGLASFVGFVTYKWWYRWHYHTRISRQYDLFLNIYFFAALFYLLAYLSPHYYTYERLTLPFSWASIFLVTHIVTQTKTKKAWVRWVMQIIAMVGALVYTMLLVRMGKHAIENYYVIGFNS